MSDALLEYAYRRIVEMEKCCWRKCRKSAFRVFCWLTKSGKCENIWFTNSKKSET